MNWTIMKHFSRKNVFGFTFQDVEREFPERNRVYLARILVDMVEMGMLYRLTGKHYIIIPLNADPAGYVPDGHQVAKYIMQNREYYIGYASAMKIHGLKLQTEPTREYIVTKKQMKPAIRNLGGVTCQFIYQEATRFFGFGNTWVNQLEEAMVSDLEKTIVDVATKPQHGCGIVEIGDAMAHAQDRINHDKLFYYFARNMNKAAKKRFLFLTDLLGLEWAAEHDRMKEELGPGISLLDPAAPDRGSIRSKFGLKINVDPVSIKKKILH